jgi:hypothetical protein
VASDDVITALAPTPRWKLEGDYLDGGSGSTRKGSAAAFPAFTSGPGIIRTQPLREALDADEVDDLVGIGDSPEISTGTGYTFVRRSWSNGIEHTGFRRYRDSTFPGILCRIAVFGNGEISADRDWT